MLGPDDTFKGPTYFMLRAKALGIIIAAPSFLLLTSAPTQGNMKAPGVSVPQKRIPSTVVSVELDVFTYSLAEHVTATLQKGGGM